MLACLTLLDHRKAVAEIHGGYFNGLDSPHLRETCRLRLRLWQVGHQTRPGSRMTSVSRPDQGVAYLMGNAILHGAIEWLICRILADRVDRELATPPPWCRIDFRSGQGSAR